MRHRKAATVSASKGSPLLTQNLRTGTRSARSSKKFSSSFKTEGTTQILVTPCLAKYSTKASGFLTVLSEIITTQTPHNIGPQSSQMESTKLRAVFMQPTSSSTNG